MRVLLVEDDRQGAAFVEAVLAQSGNAVDVTASAQEAQVLARIHSYDLLVLDLMLPDGSGLDVLREVRRAGQAVPVLVLTGRDAERDIVHVLDAGADDYLVKPVTADMLQARVRALLRRGGSQRLETLTMAGLVMNRVSHRVFVDGVELSLTNKEFDMLQHMLLHANEVVSSTEFLEKVWNMHFDPGSNVVNANVARLRRKLERHAQAPQIETVRGAGFRLVLPAPRQEAERS